ncbi:MAG: FAD-binding oxidoreductase [Planctomycetota bacterium]|nr:FAD-binding oxidoreductase [Planctomycetota bacterium]
MSSAPSWHSALAEIVGSESVAADDATLEACAAQGVKPACVCTPGDVAQAAAAIKFAAERKIPVVPRGGGTAQGIGHAPPPEALTISTRRLGGTESPAHHGLQHEPADMVATVPAGMALGALQEALGKNGQWLPLDGDAKATVGGLIATDHSGPRALGYGTLRDMVLGMTIVNGDGVARKCGGKVVKNVTGYAMEKLYIGSLGTLGLITEVTVRLRPLPIGRRVWRIDAANCRDCVAMIRAVAAKNLPLEALRGSTTLPSDGTAAWPVLVSAAGTVAELGRIERELGAAIAPAEAKSVELPEGRGEEQALGTPNLRFWCSSALLEPVLELICVAQGRLDFGMNSGAAAFPLSAEQAAKISATLVKLGANFRWENVQGLKIAEPFGPPRPEWALMRQIKAALDPQNIMNPGRFVV